MAISSFLGSSALLPAGLGFRNKIINGGFDVWQRSTSATVTGADSYSTADRWRIRTAGAGGSVTSSRQSAGLNGYQYCLRYQRVSGNTDTNALQLVQTLETSESIKLVGGSVVLSFWARSGANYSPTSSALKVYLTSGTGTDQYWLSFTNYANVIDQTATLTTTWQRFVYIATPSTSATQFSVQFQMTPTGTAGANDYFEITGVQLEANYQATPFEQRPIGVELQLCQRYYCYMNFDTGTGANFVDGYQSYGAYITSWLQFPQTMRTRPTTVTIGIGGYSNTTGWTANGVSPDYCQVYATMSVSGVNRGYYYINNVYASAEL